MIIVLKPEATEEEIKHIIEKIEELGLKVHISKGIERTIIGAIGDENILRNHPLEIYPGVEKVLPILKPYKLASRDFQKEDTVIKVKNMVIGKEHIPVIAGPCSIEGREMFKEVALAVKKAGASALRGGAFKPRTSPYSFQGLGEEGLKILSDIGTELEMPVVTELMDTRDIDIMLKYTDIIQIGARNMQNFKLLQEVGKHNVPVLLKRGMSSTIKELLMSAEYIMAEGNRKVILCERGIRTFEDSTRNTLDISAIPVLKRETHLPVIVDPSHGTGYWYLVGPLAKAAIAAGADGLIIEVHPDPENAKSDGPQSLLPSKFATLMHELKDVATSVGRKI